RGVRPSDDLSPEALRLERATLPLRLAGGLGQPVRVVHAVVIDAAGQQDEAGQPDRAGDVPGNASAPHRPTPVSAAVAVFRSYSSRYSTTASAMEEAMDF